MQNGRCRRLESQYSGRILVSKPSNENTTQPLGYGLEMDVFSCGTSFDIDIAKTATAERGLLSKRSRRRRKIGTDGDNAGRFADPWLIF